VGKRGFELLLVDHGEAVAAGVDEEAFVAEDSGAGEREDVGLVVGDRSAPWGPVDEAFVLRCGALLLECGYGCGFGETVERHVDECGVASGSGGAGCGAKAFPFGAAGLVDVNVSVDEAGEDCVMSVIVDGCVCWNFGVAADGADFFAFDEERTGARAFGCDDAV